MSPLTQTARSPWALTVAKPLTPKSTAYRRYTQPASPSLNHCQERGTKYIMRSITEIVDGAADEEPGRVWLKVPDSPANLEDTSWHDVTFRQLSRAVNVMAYWIDKHLGKADSDVKSGREPLAYMGTNDIRYPILLLAALKTGYTSLLTSPRNSVDGHLALLDATNCSKLLFGKELKIQATALQAKNPNLKAIEVPDVEQLLHDDNLARPYPSETQGKTIDEHTPIMILHSSGTTGHPKPITITAGVFEKVQNILSLAGDEACGRRYMHEELYTTPLLISAVPFFHCYGINILCRSIYHRAALVLLPADKPPSTDIMMLAMEKTKPTAVACAPSMLEDISGTPEGLGALSRLDYVFFGGAPLAHSCGDRLSKVTKLVNGIGSTEMFFAATFVPADPADWEYFEWSPRAGVEMQSSGDSESLAEMVIKRDATMEHQFVFDNFPQLDEWRTKDLFERHSKKPTLWKYVGRADDVLVLSNGEKINPVHFEKGLEGHSWIKGALMVGSGRFQAGLFIEPRSEKEGGAVNTDAFLQHVWPCIERANATYPAHAQVWRSMITLTPPDKPFVRTAKGSVMRKATYQAYEKEIDELYESHTASSSSSHADSDDTMVNRGADIRAALRDAALAVLGRAHHDNLTDQTNLFTLGMDSLQVVQLSQTIEHRLGSVGGNTAGCSPKTIYAHSSIDALSSALSRTIAPDTPRHGRNASREECMSAMIHKYTRSIPFERSRSGLPGRVVVLTGSTGSLGNHLLYRLLNSADVSHVHCLNRNPDAEERQARLFSACGMGDLQSHMSRITFHTAGLSEKWFGLTPETYVALLRSTDVLIHNAWPVDFNKTLADFEPAILSTRRCADFVAAALRTVHLVFVSSIASVMNYPAVRGGSDSPGTSVTWDQEDKSGDAVPMTVPEEFDADNSLPAKQGYGESKHVAECVLAEAVRRTGIRATILRAGQLAGPVEGEGVWNRNEWLPSLIATSKSLGKIPDSLGPRHEVVDWIPVDIAAQAMLDIAFLPPALEPAMPIASFNIVHPRTTRWREVVRAVKKFYASQGSTIETVPLGEWLDRLEGVDVCADGAALGQYPAVKLLDFFQSLRDDNAPMSCVFSTSRVLENSPTMTRLCPTDDKLIRRWLVGWAF
ncbi:hypothetical protein B0T16DRAFT_410881 [Cercophora newfieldiana]|uniref:Polyketide synthase-like phosphopantetheine-binding domain-containing protein n=1 Tax=Cercophora newfieldiana TaxID=92897 RepID=A0AA39YDJ0_9PEZI|nr:hypothetical protein B0T16DRAFT_410881 [Cercophora newfieldiana]